MDEKGNDELYNELHEIENILKKNGLFDTFKPDWVDCPDASLEVGGDYVCYMSKEICMRGHVLYNDGVTAILKIVDRYEECCFHVLDYYEVRQFFPAFTDPEATQLSEYYCIDINTKELLFFIDPDDDIIKRWQEDENGERKLCIVDPIAFRMERIKKRFLYEFNKYQKEKEEKENEEEESDTVIHVDLTNSAIDDMYKEYDQEHGNKVTENDLSYSLNRSIHWLNNRSCAIITAWRSDNTREENGRRNRILQQTLREYGYGIIRVKGCYAEIGKAVERENSFLVIDLKDSEDFMGNIYCQSETYEQDCFLYKPKDEHVAYLIGTNDKFGKGEISIAGIMRINSDNSENYSEVNSGKISFEKENSRHQENPRSAS